MIVVSVLMMSCQVLMLWMTAIDGAQITTSATQNAKNAARLTTRDEWSANRSNQPTCELTSSGILGFEVFADFADFAGFAMVISVHSADCLLRTYPPLPRAG
jgi:hypothetical protein